MGSNGSLKSALQAVECVAGAIVLQTDITPALGTRLKIDHPELLYLVALGPCMYMNAVTLYNVPFARLDA